MKRIVLNILTLLVLTVLNAQAATYYVATTGNNAYPGTQAQPFKTIQKGIDTAVNGDTVLMVNGTYSGAGNRNLNFGGKSFTLRSQGGAANCIIDCGGTGNRGLQFIGGETAQMVVDGLTVRNGLTTESSGGSAGGAVLISSASPTLRNCLFTNNQATAQSRIAFGGAAVIGSGSPTFLNCTFTNNKASSTNTNAYGGAVYIQGDGQVQLTGCTLSGNTAQATNDAAYGGGIAGLAGQIVVTNTTLFHNRAVGSATTIAAMGGGVYVLNSGTSFTLINSSLASNVAYAANGAACGGGAVSLNGSQLLLTNTLVVNNAVTSDGTSDTSYMQGGGIYTEFNSATVILTHCVVATNSASGVGANREGWGGGLLANGGGSITITNSIIFINQAVYSSSSEFLAANGGVLTVTYCNAIREWDPVPDANHNFGADPRFVRWPSWGADGIAGTDDDDGGDLHLQADSSSLDMANAAAAGEPGYDKDANNRIAGSAPDIGAYELGATLFLAESFYVDKATGSDTTGDGTQAHPFQTVSKALTMVSTPVIGISGIYIKAGNYGSDRPRVTKRVKILNWGNTGQARIGKP